MTTLFSAVAACERAAATIGGAMREAVRDTILRQGRGAVLLDVQAECVEAYLRENALYIREYPHHCSAEARFVSWTFDGVTVCAFVMNFAKKSLLTFQSWLNPMDARDRHVIEGLATVDEIIMNVCCESMPRKFRTHNFVRREAAAVVLQLRRDTPSWTREQFDEACRRLDVEYPTAHLLFRTYARSSS
jgi:hypothetical protein